MPGKIESSSQMGVFLLRFDVHSSIGLEVSVYSISGTIWVFRSVFGTQEDLYYKQEDLLECLALLLNTERF